MPLLAVIDDDVAARESVGSFVRSLGYAVEGFASAADFLESEIAASTACIISDVQMPGVTGFDLLRRVATGERHIPVILMTAWPHESLATLAAGEGAVCLLPKPVHAEALVECLERALGDDGRRAG